MAIYWINTRPSPYTPATGHDAGQKGWKLHAVEAESDQSFNEIRGRRALCGLLPRWGWSLDAFIEDKCERCLSKMPREPKAVAEGYWAGIGTGEG